jgi:hypothetical protein
MTLAEYLDAARFPVTSRAGYTPREQLMMDAFNLDQLRQAIDEGEARSESQKSVLAELHEKAPHLAALTAEVAALTKKE